MLIQTARTTRFEACPTPAHESAAPARRNSIRQSDRAAANKSRSAPAATGGSRDQSFGATPLTLHNIPARAALRTPSAPEISLAAQTSPAQHRTFENPPPEYRRGFLE